MRASRRPGGAFALAVAAALGVAGCAGSTGPSTQSRSSDHPTGTVRAASVGALGTILVDGTGRTVYMFPPDARHAVTCTTRCAAIWPPLTVPAGTAPQAGAGVRPGLLGTVADPGATGKRVVTYNGWPLYTYVEDTRPGQATGQGLDRNGGLWYVLRPSGAIEK